MSRIGIYRTDTGALECVTPAADFNAGREDMTGRATVAVPDGFGAGAPLAWDAATLSFVEDFTAIKDARWAEAKAIREARICGGCMSPLGKVDTTTESQIKISGAVQMAMLAQASAQPFSIGWTMFDNTVKPHDAAAMIALGMAVGQHVAACHAAGVEIRAAIMAATTLAEIEAVDITSGYPVV